MLHVEDIRRETLLFVSRPEIDKCMLVCRLWSNFIDAESGTLPLHVGTIDFYFVSTTASDYAGRLELRLIAGHC